MKSIWKNNHELQQNEHTHLPTNVHTVVIGAGMAGILTAYFLKKKGHQVIVIEAEKTASGQTGNTTAKITSQHDLFYDKLIRQTGMKRAAAYAMANEGAIRMYEQIINEENIACHFKRLPAYLYTTSDCNIDKLKKEAKAAKSLGIDAYFISGEKLKELPFTVKGAVCFDRQAQFHPVEFIEHLAKGLEIYENTRVLSVKKHMVCTDRGNISAENIVFATHYPFINVPGFYFLRQHQERSYVLALDKLKELPGMYYSIDEYGLSLRSEGEILLLGGGGHRTGKQKCGNKEKAGAMQKSSSMKNLHNEQLHSEYLHNEYSHNKYPQSEHPHNECLCQKQGYTYLRAMAKKYYPDAHELTAWSAQDCMPHDNIPFIGRYSIFRPYWYVATGFKKWGMTSSLVAAMIISNQICGVESVYDKTFTPQRFLLRASFKKLIIDVGESIDGLTKGLFSGKERRCRHMGCRLEWNEEENTWECPCHGSSYDREGRLKDNPAQADMHR